jgi:GNAT superfamily N-acetyltransferase
VHIELRNLRAGDRECLADVDGGNGWNADPDLWANYTADQTSGRRLVVIAWEGERPVGYGTLVWEPGYERFRAASIPEISNLGVDIKVRRLGVATALIRYFEDRAREAGRTTIGLGVGLYADYGPAQRLYFRLGYRPDGHGITYADRPLAPGETVRLDDDLVLWLSKAL